MLFNNTVFLTVIGTMIFTGCATMKPHAGFEEVQKSVSQRIEKNVSWNSGKTEDESITMALEKILNKKLTADETVQIALLKNPSLQATFEDIGIARAGLVQAGLVESPIFQVGVGFPHGSGGNKIASNVSVTQNFMDVLQRPLRKKVAEAHFEETKFRITDVVLKLATEVKTAYYTYQWSLQMFEFRRSVVLASEVASKLAEAQRKAGNISDLDLMQQQSALQLAKLEFKRIEMEVQTARDTLDRLMGFPGVPFDWQIVKILPPLPQSDPAFENMESQALSQRFDLAAAEKKIDASEGAVKLARSQFLPALNIGVAHEFDSEGNMVVGPTVGIGLPFLGHRKAAIGQATAHLRKSQREKTALEADIKSELRLVFNKLTLARKAAEYHRGSILPLQENLVGESLKHYNYMLLGNYQLLLAKQNQINAQSNYINAVKDYWVAYSELERIAGGELNKGGKDE